MNLIDYWPRFMQKLREFVDLAKAEQPEIDRLKKRLEQIPDEFFLDTMTIYGVKRWEKILDIKPTPNDTLEDRRFTIKIRLFSRLPYTFRRMIQQLESLLGPNNFEATMHYDERRLDVGIALFIKNLYNRHIDMKNFPFTHAQLRAKNHKEIKEIWFYPENQKLYNEILRLLRRMIPANTLLNVYFIYNRHMNIKDSHKTHAELKVLTHLQIKEQEVIR